MKLLLKTFSVILVLAFGVLSNAPAQRTANCNVIKSAFWTWPPGVQVKVFVIAESFKPDELSYLLAPLRDWNAASQLTASGVSFDYRGEVATDQDCLNCLTIKRGPVFDETTRHATELHAVSASSDRIITYAAIVIDPKLTNRKALVNAVAHELGHSFGLPDCHTCRPKTTVMNQFRALNVPNGMDGPTKLDVLQVSQIYKTLVASRGRQTGVDEGEEPEEDDTPVVLSHPSGTRRPQ